jgi:hypothetical protein
VPVLAFVGAFAGRDAFAEASNVTEGARLFEEARILMEAGRYPEACPAFARSESLDAHVGTMANLAYCYEHLGKTASAWKWWIQSALAYGARGKMDEAEVARSRAAQLEPHLAKVTVSVELPDDQPALEVRIDGEPLPKAAWNATSPLDPGSHVVEALAPGRQRWSLTIDVNDDHVPEVTVPVLKEAPLEQPWTKKVGLALGAGGLSAMAVGLAFGGAAIVAHSRELPYCSATVTTNCSGGVVVEQSQMKTDATIAGVTFAVGGAALVTAAILWFSPVDRSPSTRGLTWQPAVARNGASLSVGSVW